MSLSLSQLDITAEMRLGGGEALATTPKRPATSLAAPYIASRTGFRTVGRIDLGKQAINKVRRACEALFEQRPGAAGNSDTPALDRLQRDPLVELMALVGE